MRSILRPKERLRLYAVGHDEGRHREEGDVPGAVFEAAVPRGE